MLTIGAGGGGGAPHGSEGKDGGSGGGGGCNKNNGGSPIADTRVGYAGGYGTVNWSSAGSAGGGGGGGAGSTGDTPEGGSGYVSHPGNRREGVDLSGVFGDDYGQNGLFAGGGGGTEGYYNATNTSVYQRPIGKAGGGDGGQIEYNSSTGYNEDDGTDARPYTGAGGGGGNFSENTTTSGGDGGSGIVVARFALI